MTPWDGKDTAREWPGKHPWDICHLAGRLVPGIARVRVKRGRNVDQRELIGQMASTTFLSYKPSEVTIEVTMWTDDHLRDLELLLRDIEPVREKEIMRVSLASGHITIGGKPAGGKGVGPQPVRIDSPATDLRRVDSIFVMSIDGPVHKGQGIWTLTIHAAEWWPVNRKHVGTPFSPTGAWKGNYEKGFGKLTTSPSHTPPRPSASMGERPR